MEQLRRVLASIRTHMGGMQASHKLLIGSLVATAAMTLVLVAVFTGKPSMVALPGIDPADQDRVSLTLMNAGIETELKGGQLWVPVGQERRAIAQLTEQGQLPDDTTILFNNLVTKQDWRNSREQNRQQYIFALQNELGKVIGQMRGVKSATVIIDAPESQGLGRATREPTASATIFTIGGGALSQDLVDAVASLVSGARAGLRLENVAVIDGTTGLRRDPTDESRRVAGSYLEHAQQVEHDVQRKLEQLLQYIPGVVVAVTAQVDVTRVSQHTRRHLPVNDGTISLPSSETGMSKSQTRAAAGAEPGVRSMQGADINQGNGSVGDSLDESEDMTTFENAVGYEEKQVVDPRGMPTHLAASIAVPRGFIVELLNQETATGGDPAAGGGGGAGDPNGGGGGAGPTQEQVLARFDELRLDIERVARPHLRVPVASGDDPTGFRDGEVSVAMAATGIGGVPVGVQQAGFMSLFAGGEGGGGGSILGSAPLDTVLVGGLALVALAMMVMMVRKSSKRVDLPSAEELVGVPPALQAENDLVGEAEESESPMTGIEVGEDEVRQSKMLDQVAEMVASDPEKAAKLVQRWMAVED